ncbi:uncharacterized protein ColSpa_01687 [Colletotrichum spaethianum]|uniref:Uncharacterized protein n=1 Tax=Colletotrichum spaethianum TaxID=700344 RepID=A0AA37L4C4_9PEZI|nr:uncharacterized protein ColSpa_01687 [Colletotrichum spaethianum]GKT41506.1 hypothetical protein ColSpa_01687 [Colletotrichum spaethianum]
MVKVKVKHAPKHHHPPSTQTRAQVKSTGARYRVQETGQTDSRLHTAGPASRLQRYMMYL